MKKILITGILLTLLISQVSALPFYRNPESSFYGVFRAMERIESVFALNNRRRMEIAIMHAERRAEELTIIEKEATFTRIQAELQERVEAADRLSDGIQNGGTQSRLRERLRVLNTNSLQVLEQARVRFQER